MKKLFFLSAFALATIACSNPKSPESLKKAINRCIGRSNQLALTERVRTGNIRYSLDDEDLEKTKELAKKGIVEIKDLGKNLYDIKINPKYINNTPSDGIEENRLQNLFGKDNIKICDLKVEEVKNLRFWEELGVKNVSVDAVLVPVDANIKIEPITRTLALEDDGNGGEYKFCKE